MIMPLTLWHMSVKQVERRDGDTLGGNGIQRP